MNPHYVYRCFDAQGGLLYVGCSMRPLARIKEHRVNSWWGSDYHSARLTVFPTRRKALTIEAEAICAEMPRCNVTGRWSRLDPRDHWTAKDYLDFRHAVIQATELGGPVTQQLLSDVAAELLARHNVSTADVERAA